jgi:ribosomal-protein-alanine N-acetyltransferase
MIFPFVRSEPEMRALRECVELWRQGPEKFWGYDDVLEALGRPRSLGFFAADAPANDSWRGVILADVGPFTADLLYVYVKPEHRRSGLGKQLVARLIEELEAHAQLEGLFLEVRSSNTPAQTLYRKLGMEQVGTRKAYYADGEDALIFKAPLGRGKP